MDTHRKYMDRCYALAETAAAEGERPMGRVIEKDEVWGNPPKVTII